MIDPHDVQILPLDPACDAEAAAILAAATGEDTAAAGAARIAALRADPEAELYGLVVDGSVVAAYALRKVGPTLELPILAVAEEHRRRGHGRACLADALRRAGRRPLAVETDDDALGFYRACGFKLVGKRRGPGGRVRYRLGAHAPRPSGDRPLLLVRTPGGGADAEGGETPAGGDE